MSPLDELRRALEADTRVMLAVLFGSAARDQLRRESDLDVGVLGPAQTDLNALQVKLERATGRTVDLVSLVDAPPCFVSRSRATVACWSNGQVISGAISERERWWIGGIGPRRRDCSTMLRQPAFAQR